MNVIDLRSVLALGLVATLAACGGADEAPAETEAPAEAPAVEAEAPAAVLDIDLPDGMTAEMVAQGAQLFAGAGVCQACHGPGGNGSMGIAPDLTDAEWLNVDGSLEAIAEVVMTGVDAPKQFASPMPPRGGSTISDEEVQAVAAYVWTLSQGG